MYMNYIHIFWPASIFRPSQKKTQILSDGKTNHAWRIWCLHRNMHTILGVTMETRSHMTSVVTNDTVIFLILGLIYMNIIHFNIFFWFLSKVKTYLFFLIHLYFVYQSVLLGFSRKFCCLSESQCSYTRLLFRLQRHYKTGCCWLTLQESDLVSINFFQFHSLTFDIIKCLFLCW